MPKAKRVNLSKEEIEAQIRADLKLSKQKDLARKIFPSIAHMDTVYDAQTVLNALAGFIKFGLQKKESEFTVRDMAIDFTKEKASTIKDAVIELLAVVEHENARDAADMLEMMASRLPGYIATVHMADKMDTITIDKFIA